MKYHGKWIGGKSARWAIGGLALFLWIGMPDAPAASVYESDWTAFCAKVDSAYPFFDLKGNRLEWDTAKARISEQIKTCASDSAFLALITDAFRPLHDAHMGLRDTKTPIPDLPKEYFPGISFMPATENRVVLMAMADKYKGALTLGMILLTIDGQDARKMLDESANEVWNKGFSSGKQRARMLAYRIPMCGAQGAKHTLVFFANAGEKKIEVSCDDEARGWPHTYNMPRDLTQTSRSLQFGKLSGGTGYLYLRRVDQNTEAGLRQALEAHPAAKGWIVDLRGNGGGGYDMKLVDQMKKLPQPVVALIDAGCMSAGETLARDLTKAAQAKLFGSATAGASSEKRVWKFPSGVASVVMATRSRWRADGQPIEFNGIAPDIEVEAVPEEVAKGMNSEILRAQEYLAQAATTPPQPDSQTANTQPVPPETPQEDGEMER